LRITHLQIENFRNISQIDIELSPVLNGFWGNNGQGKTNILEAIFSACKLKSFRPYSSKKDWYPRLIHNTPQTKVEIFLETNRQYGHKIQLANDDGKRWQSFWDDKKASAQQIQSKVPILAFSPDDHSLIRGGPEGRRDFFDALLIDIAPGYAEILQRYHKALKQRNELIRSFENDKKKVIPELSTWTTLLIQEGFDLSLIRREFWPLFRSQFLSTTQKLFKNEFPGLKIECFGGLLHRGRCHNDDSPKVHA
jgi:DNA replication and repair protein RecF